MSAAPASFGLTERKGLVVMPISREQKLIAEIEFTPRQWLDFASRGNTIASEILRQEETP